MMSLLMPYGLHWQLESAKVSNKVIVIHLPVVGRHRKLRFTLLSYPTPMFTAFPGKWVPYQQVKKTESGIGTRAGL